MVNIIILGSNSPLYCTLTQLSCRYYSTKTEAKVHAKQKYNSQYFGEIKNEHFFKNKA